MIPTLLGNAKGENICWTISKDIEVKIKNLTITKLKSVECTYEAQSTSISADDKVVYTVSSLAEGSGTLTVLGLTGEEKKLIFGGKATKGFALGVDDVQPQMALLFEQKKADGKICRVK